MISLDARAASSIRIVIKGRHLSELVPAALPAVARRERITFAYDSIDKDFVTFRTAVVSSLLDPRSNPLPLFELNIAVDQTERDREESEPGDRPPPFRDA